MDNNTLYTILQRYFKALSYTGYIQLQDLQYLIVLVYIKDIQEYVDQSIIDKALEIIKSKCIFYNNSFDTEDQEYYPIIDNGYSIDFFNINLSSDKIKINIGQGSNIKSVTIPSATQQLAGVLSSNDKVVIGKINEAIDQNILIGGLSTQQSADTISIGYSQMNPDSSFEDNHINLPLATQSKAGLLSKEDKYIIDNVRSDIAEAEITSFNKTATPNNVTLTLQSANSEFSVQLNRANLGEAGLVLGTDIDTINMANSLLTNYRPLVDEINVTPTENTVELEYLYYDGNDQSVYSYDVELPAATTTTAGIMTASDKSVVNNANTLLSNSPLVDKLQFAVADNKRWLQYKNNGNSLFTGIPMPVFAEKLSVIADYTLTGSTDCTINLLALDNSVVDSATIPVVNERNNGVMSTSMYVDLINTSDAISNIQTSIESLNNSVITTYDVGYNSDSVDVNLLSVGNAPIEANIEAATTTTAGVMSAQDKQQLTNVVSEMPTVSDSIEDGVKQGIHYVVWKNQLVAMMKDGIIQYAPKGLIYTEADEPFSFTVGSKTYNVEAGNQYTYLNIDGNVNLENSFRGNTIVKKVIPYIVPSSLLNAFWGASNLEYVDCSNIDTSRVTSIAYLFRNCTNLKEADVSKFDTSNCLEFSAAFYGCSLLEKIDVSKWDTSKATNLGYLFLNCKSLKEVDVSGFDTSKSQSLAYMFHGCNLLQNIDVSKFNTSNCTNMKYMFSGTAATELPVSNFDTSNVTDMGYMFSLCSKLEELNLSSFNTSHTKSMIQMFSNCTSLYRLDLSNFDTSSLDDCTYMFNNCTNLQYLDISNFNPSNIKYPTNMLYYCTSLHTLKFPNMGMLPANSQYTKVINLALSPLGSPIGITDPDIIAESEKALIDLFSYDRVANGLTNPLTVKLSTTTKGLTHIFTDEALALISARGYTIA